MLPPGTGFIIVYMLSPELVESEQKGRIKHAQNHGNKVLKQPKHVQPYTNYSENHCLPPGLPQNSFSCNNYPIQETTDTELSKWNKQTCMLTDVDQHETSYSNMLSNYNHTRVKHRNKKNAIVNA